MIKRSSKGDPVYLLNKAEKIKEEKPTEAIELLEEVISLSRKQGKKQQSAKAYILLGNIYEQIGQQELALKRYQSAEDVLNPKADPDLAMQVDERQGRIYLSLSEPLLAKLKFEECLQVPQEEVQPQLKCEEGLLDVQLSNKDTAGFAQRFHLIQNNYPLDSLAQARLEARRTLNYIQQNDFYNASISYSNTLQSLPRTKKLSKEDFAPVQKAQDDLFESEAVSSSEKIDAIRQQAVSQDLEFPPDAKVRENLKIAEIYVKDNNFIEAERFVRISKDLVVPETDDNIVATVYKRSSEINQRRGKFEAARKDLELYVKAKERAISKLEMDLQEQIEIVKGQQGIDVRQKDVEIAEKQKELLQAQLRTQQVIIGLLALILVASLVFFFFLYKNIQAKRKANQKLLLKSLRTQMNPHFIFNALNSVNSFIAQNDEKAANKFLADFSRLMRQVLDHSQKDFISFEEELELNELYLKLEHFRFRDKFEYSFQSNLTDTHNAPEVPPMLIQPFIENAVWHGLRYLEGKGRLDVNILHENERYKVIIEDNGIGRKRSKALKTINQKKYKSTGLENVEKRISLLNNLYHTNYQVEVTDRNPGLENTGTKVVISIGT